MSYSASTTFAAPANAGSGLPTTIGLPARRRRRAAHVLEEILGRRERRRRRLLPVHLELPRRVDRLLFALAHDGDVVALADDLDESRQAAHRRLVDADELRAGDRRLHVARVHHARQLDVHRPLQRAVDLGGNVVALRRLADDLQLLHRLDLRDAGRRVDVVAGQRDVELLAADQLAVGDALRRIGLHGDHGGADRELHRPARRSASAAISSSTRRASAATRRIGQPSV